MIITCDNCNKEFDITNFKYNRSKTHCCSKECSNQLKSKKVIVKCKRCASDILVIESRAKKHNTFFCSKECETVYKYDKSHKTVHCEVCGKDMILEKSSTQRFCCVDCQNEWQTTNVGIKNKKFSRLLISCDYCGKEFYQREYKVKSQQYNFCCDKCKREWYANVYSQQEWYKNEKRKVAVKMLEDGVFGNVDTAPQKIINSLLKDNDINFQNEYNCKYYSIDNYITDYNLMIEVMGDYWHCNPNKYKIIKNKKHIDRIPKDKAKHTYIKNKYNIEILYLWEYDIHNNLDVCKLLIEEYVGNGGVLKNYHSFNYELVENKIQLKKDLIIPYQDMESKVLKNYIVNAQSLDI